jgi:hypothetical protein
MKQRTAPAVVFLLAIAAAATAQSQAAASPPVNVRTARAPDGGLYPQAAVDAAGVVHLIYFKGDPLRGNVFYVRSADAGRTFSPPLRVNSQTDSCILTGTVRGPQMAVGKNGRVHVAWMGSDKARPRAAGRQTPMLYSRLNDAGDAFEPQRNLIQSYPGLDGGGSVAADAEGNVYVAWHAPLKEQNEADRHVWVVRSADDGKTFGPETMADSDPVGVCGCCGMRIFATPRDGHVYVLYRSALNTVNRDMRLLVSSDHGRTFKLALDHPWQIGQCVMSTSAFNATADGAVLASWETKQQIYLAKVAAGDDAPQEPVAAAAPGQGPNRKHPAVAANARGQFVLAWTEGTGWNQGGSVAWQAFDENARPLAGQAGRVEGLPVWSAPSVVAGPDGGFTIFY